MRRQVNMSIFYWIAAAAALSGLLFAVMIIRGTFARTQGPASDARQVQSAPMQSAGVQSGTKESAAREKERVVTAGKLLEPTYAFVLRVNKEDVCVYTAENNQLYMNTGLKLKEFPRKVQKKISSGMGFETEDELYSFLESYSS